MIKYHIARFATQRVRVLAGLREMPKFFVVRLMNLIRQSLLNSAAGLVEVGILKQVDDIFFLSLDKLRELASFQNANGSWTEVTLLIESNKSVGEIVEKNRHNNRLEMTRGQIPRLILSDGSTFYEGLSESESSLVLQGDPVSPGVVEGLVRVVHEPRQAILQTGEIMVCRGTDPSWTPLFLSAHGLIMEVGGLMTHGSVVAREYGIPAVVGVTRVTEHLITGQRIRVDGSTGKIEVI